MQQVIGKAYGVTNVQNTNTQSTKKLLVITINVKWG